MRVTQKAFFIVTIFLAIFLSFSLMGYSTIYYVDATDGDDAKDGLSEANAWQTWAKVAGTTFSAGDTIKFQCGESWDTRSPWTLDDSGTSGNVITIDSYGAGAAPIWDGRDELNGRVWNDNGGNVWWTTEADDCYRITLDGVDSYYAANVGAIDATTYLWFYDDPNSKIYVYSTQNPNTEYTNITAYLNSTPACLYIKGSYITVQNIRIYGGKYSIYSMATAADLTNVTISNVDMWYGNGGLQAYRTEFSSNYWTVDSCDIDAKVNYIDVTGLAAGQTPCDDGIGMRRACNNWTISNNTITDWGHAHISIHGDSATALTCSNNIVENNLLRMVNAPRARGFELQGLDGLCANNIVRYNIETGTSTRSHVGGNDNEVYYNLFYGKVAEGEVGGSPSSGINLDEVLVAEVCDGCKVYNNVFYDIYKQAIEVDDATNCVIKNNIMMKCGEDGTNIAVFVTDDAQGGGNIFSNNCIYDADTTTTIDVDSLGTCTVAFADANYAEFSDNLASDPLFRDAAGGDFRLLMASPCIDAGTDVSLVTDHEGKRIRHAPDIGAYENQTNALFIAKLYKLYLDWLISNIGGN